MCIRDRFSAVQREVRAVLLGTTPGRAASGQWSVFSNQWSVGQWGGGAGGDRAGFAARDDEGERPAAQLDIPWQLRPPAPETGEGELSAPTVAPPAAAETRLPIMRVVGQVGAAYIIAEGPEGLYLIDQHAAHERILYEQLLAQWRQRHVASQGLVAPATVYLRCV